MAAVLAYIESSRQMSWSIGRMDGRGAAWGGLVAALAGACAAPLAPSSPDVTHAAQGVADEGAVRRVPLRPVDGGPTVSLDVFAGRVVLVDFWASWCEPCRRSMPVYAELHTQRAAAGLELVSVDVGDDAETLAAYLERSPVPFRVYHDPDGVLPRAAQVEAMPTALLFDRGGRLRFRLEGFTSAGEAELRARVEALLAEAPPSASAARAISDERALMSTVWRVTVRGSDEAAARAAIDASLSRVAEVERDMSEWRDESPLSRLNRAAGRGPVPLSAELLDVLRVAKRVSEESEGAFDVTWAALWGLWRFDRPPALPDPAPLSAARALIDHRGLTLDLAAGTAALARPGMAVGLGGIAKGHALVAAADELRRRGYSDFLLNAGGQVYAVGDRGDGPWRVGIQDPRGAAGELFAKLEVRDASVSTSGDYEHFFFVGGKRYHHIIDPRTGMPAAQGVTSATVVMADPTLADAYSTAVVVLGAREGLALLARVGAEGVVVEGSGEVHVTPGLAGRVTILRAPGQGP